MTKPTIPMDTYDFRRAVTNIDLEIEGVKSVWVRLNGEHYAVTGVSVDDDGDLLIEVSA